MTVGETLLLLGFGATLLAASVVGDRARRRAPLAWHAHLPWNGLALLAMTAMLLAVVHLVRAR